MKRFTLLTAVPVLAAAAVPIAWSTPDPSDGMRSGAPAIRSVGALTFGMNDILFIGDSEGASVFAVKIDEAAASNAGAPIEVKGIDAKVAQVLGTTPDNIRINDMAVHPVSQNVYLSVMRGVGADARPVLLRVTRNASMPIEEVPLQDVRFSAAAIPNAPAADPQARRNPRTFTITDLAYADGQVYVAGLSNEEFASSFRRMAYPFTDRLETSTLEIYHVSHGRNETQAPIMTFIPKRLDGQMYILAAYTCTPLVAFPMKDLKDGQHVFGRTVADLGAGNQPLDMISITRDGREQVIVANSRHPLMRVDASDIAAGKALVDPTKDMGIPRVATERTGITQLDDLNADWVVVIQSAPGGGMDLRSIAKKSI
jgi:hypothetical protein